MRRPTTNQRQVCEIGRKGGVVTKQPASPQPKNHLSRLAGKYSGEAWDLLQEEIRRQRDEG